MKINDYKSERRNLGESVARSYGIKFHNSLKKLFGRQYSGLPGAFTTFLLTIMLTMVSSITSAQTENTITVVPSTTWSVQGGKNEPGVFDDQAEHYYNNWGSSTNAWVAQAYIAFSLNNIPSGHFVKGAKLSITVNCSGSQDNRNLDIYALPAKANATDYKVLTDKPNNGTLVAEYNDIKRTYTEKTVDVSKVVRSAVNSGAKQIIFVFSNGAAGGNIKGKAATDGAPSLSLELTDKRVKTVSINAKDTEGKFLKTITSEDVYEGDASKDMYFTRGIKVGNDYYLTDDQYKIRKDYYKKQCNYNSEDINITYKLDTTVKYYGEESKLYVNKSYNGTDNVALGRASGGAWSYLDKGQYAGTAPLEAGVYDFEVAGRNAENEDKSFEVRVLNTNNSFSTSSTQCSWPKSETTVIRVEGITIQNGQRIVVYNPDASNRLKVGIDYIIAYKRVNPTATCVLKYVDNAGNELKERDTIAVDANAPIIVADKYRQAIYNSDNTIKYIYDKDDADDRTAKLDETNVVTVTFKEAQKSVVKVHAKTAAKDVVLKTFETTCFEGDSPKNLFWTRGVEHEGKWYLLPANNSSGTNYGKSVSYGDEESNLTYTLNEQVMYYAEDENINVKGQYNGTGQAPERASGGSWQMLDAASYAYTNPLQGGVYTFEYSGRAENAGQEIFVKIRRKDESLSDVINTKTWGASENAVVKLEDVVIEQGESFVIGHNAAQRTKFSLDYVIAYKTKELDDVVKYTVKYHDTDGNELKPYTFVYVDKNTTAINLADAQKASIKNEDKTKKYIYKSDDSADKTINKDGTTIVTVTFREAQKYSYTAKAKYGNKTKALAEGSVFEGDAATIYYPQYILDSENVYLYNTNKNNNNTYWGNTFTPAKDGDEYVKEYTLSEKKTNVIFYEEAEDMAANIENLERYEDNYTNIRMSNGAAATTAGKTVTLCTLPRGIYTIESSTRTGTIHFYVGDEELMTMKATGGVIAPVSREFVCTEDTPLKVMTEGAAKDSYFDYLLIRKILDYEDNNQPPVFTALPTELDIPRDALLGFKVESQSIVGIQWYRYQTENGKETEHEAINGATTLQYTCRPSEEGVWYYYCKATNPYGETKSNVCKVTVKRRLLWNFHMDEQSTNDVRNSINKYGSGKYFKEGGNGEARFVVGELSDEPGDILINPYTPLSTTAGLLFNHQATNYALLGASTSDIYNNKIQLNKGAVTLKNCTKGDEIIIRINYTTNDNYIKGSNVFCNAERSSDLENIPRGTFEYTYSVTDNNDVTLDFKNINLLMLQIIPAGYERKNCTYSVNAVDPKGNVIKEIRKNESTKEFTWISGINYPHWLTKMENDSLKLLVNNATEAHDTISYSAQYKIESDTLFNIWYNYDTTMGDIVYYNEGENIQGATAISSANVTNKASMCVAAVNDNVGNIYLTTLEPGTYRIKALVYHEKDDRTNVDSENEKTLKFTFGDIQKNFTPRYTLDTGIEEISQTVVITKESDVVWLRSGNDKVALDAIAISDIALQKATTPKIIVDEDNDQFTIIRGDNSNDNIYYTIDGTTPTMNNGKQYNIDPDTKEGEKIHIAGNCVIKAVAINVGKNNSDPDSVVTKLTTYELQAIPTPVGKGTITYEPAVLDNKYTVGTKVSIAASPKEGLGFTGWTKDAEGNNVLGTSFKYEATVSKNADENIYYAQFAEGPVGSLTFDIDNAILISTDGKVMKNFGELKKSISGKENFPATTATKVSTISIPTDYTIFTDEGTLMYWIEKKNEADSYKAGDNFNASSYKIHELGENSLFTNADQEIILIPVFRAQCNYGENNLGIKSEVIHKRINKSNITWDFRRSNGAQALNIAPGAERVPYSTHATLTTDAIRDGIMVDVPIYFNTQNTDVAIDNSDLDTWCTLSEGTKITLPSGYGAKFTLATYGKIDAGGTTFGGKAPDNVHDEYIPKNADNAYLYTWVIKSNADSIDLVIGNDFSYYQYITAELPTSEVKQLVLNTNNRNMGTIGAEQDPIEFTEEGALCYISGTRVTVKARRKDFYELDYWKTSNGYTIRPNGDVFSPDNNSIGNCLSDMVQLGTNGVNVQIGDVASETAPTDRNYLSALTVEMNTSLELWAYFKEKNSYYVTFTTGGKAEGLPLEQMHIEEGVGFTMPSHNQQLYLQGHTLKNYVDEDGNKYEFGKSYNSDKDLVLTPVFEANTKSRGDISEEATITWPLAQNSGATKINFTVSNGLIVDQIEIDGEKQDLPLYIIAVGGAADNTYSNAYCSVANGCMMTVPTSENCNIELCAAGVDEFSSTTIAGASSRFDAQYTKKYTAGTTVNVTYTGSESTQDIIFGEQRNCTYVKVTYTPLENKPELETVTIGTEKQTDEFVNALKNNRYVSGIETSAVYDDDVLVKVSATATFDGVVQITQPTAEEPTATLLLTTSGGVTINTYKINFDIINKVAPTFKSAKVNGKELKDDIKNVAVKGTIDLTFDHPMKDTTVTVLGQEIKAKANGKTLTLTYWNLDAGTTYEFQIPANSFVDTYGEKYTQEIKYKFTTTAPAPIAKHMYDFVVTHKQVWDAEKQIAGARVQVVPTDVIEMLDTMSIKSGTIDDAIALANEASGSSRFYILVPDGEYNLKGNETLATGQTYDSKNGTVKLNELFYNGKTTLRNSNVSIIGQSQEGTILYNNPFINGADNTAVLNIDARVSDTYLQDITLDNRYSKAQVDGGNANPGGAATALYDGGIHTIMKNVAMKSYDATYVGRSTSTIKYSGLTSYTDPYTSHRYYEDCQIWGSVNFIMGTGDDWWERPTIKLRRRGNATNIALPYSVTEDKWGWIFSNGVIEAESESVFNSQNGRFILGTPQAFSPAVTYLNMTFNVDPVATGWGNNAKAQNLILRMHEYGSLTSTGTPMDMTLRTLRASTPSAGSDECVLTGAQAAKYELHNVLGGAEAYAPETFTKQIDFDDDENLTLADKGIFWGDKTQALCYVIFRLNEKTQKYEFYAMTTQTSFQPGDDQGGRTFYVRAANMRGGLGKPSKPIVYEVLQKFTVTIKQVGPEPEKGWATICLPINSRVTNNKTDITIYRATGQKSMDGEINTLSFKKCEYVLANQGYVLYATPGVYTFIGTFYQDNEVHSSTSVLEGNPEDEPVSVGTKNIYTLAYKETINPEMVGFYKYTKSTIGAHKAYLSSDKLKILGIDVTEMDGAGSKGGLRFIFEGINDDATAIDGVEETTESSVKGIYNLEGKAVQNMQKGHIYIVDGEKQQY